MRFKIGARLATTERLPTHILPARRRTKIRALFPVRAKLVVLLTFFRIAEDLVGFVNFFEFLLGDLFVLGDVGMILPREFPEGFAKVVLAGAARHAQDF